MNWYWRVRIHEKAGRYWHGQIKTGRNLTEIDCIQDFYKMLTGCRMLIEGMSEQADPHLADVRDAFDGLWASRIPPADSGGAA